jgi:hypothetical protein
MKKLLILLILLVMGLAVYKGWEYMHKPDGVPPLSETPYVAVYGRDSCGYTQRMLKDLGDSGIVPKYFKVDDKRVADTLHERMRESGIATQRYNLPVVDVNGEIFVRPALKQVLDKYSR